MPTSRKSNWRCLCSREIEEEYGRGQSQVEGSSHVVDVMVIELVDLHGEDQEQIAENQTIECPD